MKNVKKLLALLLAMVMLFTVCACGGTEPVDDDEGTSASAKKNPKKDNAEKLEGAWLSYDDGLLMYLDEDGIGYIVDEYDDGVEFEWEVDGDELILIDEDGEEEALEYELDGDELILVNQDGDELIFERYDDFDDDDFDWSDIYGDEDWDDEDWDDEDWDDEDWDDEDYDELTEADLNGEWEVTFTSDVLYSVMGIEEIAVYETLGINAGDCTLSVTFEDGEAIMEVDGLIDWYVDFMEELVDWVSDGDNILEFVALVMSDEETEYTAEDIEEIMEEEDMDTDDLKEEFLGEMSVDEMEEEMRDSLEDEVSDYELSGNELNFDDGEEIWIFTYSDGEICVVEVELEDGDEVIFLEEGDLVLKKK